MRGWTHWLSWCFWATHIDSNLAIFMPELSQFLQSKVHIGEPGSRLLSLQVTPEGRQAAGLSAGPSRDREEKEQVEN